jgi:DUF438 domain-containing protein
MDQHKIDQLTALLKRLNDGEGSAAVKAEAKEFLGSISATDLSIAEQQLIAAGLAPEDLRHLCSAHMEMLEGELGKMKAQLAPGHVIQTMVNEHEVILGFLDELEATNRKLQAKEQYENDDADIQRLGQIADNLLGAEPHHQREEEALFPAVEKCGVFGPTQVMVMEHKDLRRYKHEIKDACDKAAETDFAAFKQKINASSKLIIAMLRDHIFKENNILYPTALEVIKDSAEWDRLKIECDKIGYCGFTPKI